jgi:outer membrane protein assembly factor BamB
LKTKHKFILIISIAVLAGALLLTSCSPLGCATPISRGWPGGTLDNGTLFVASMNGKIIAVNPATNTVIGSSPQLTTTASGGILSCSASSSPLTFYTTPIVSDITDPVTGVLTQMVYVGGWKNGVIYAYTLKGAVWSTAPEYIYPRQGNGTGDIVGNITIANNNIYFATSDGTVYALTANDLTLEWSKKIDTKIWSAPAVDGTTLYIGCFNKTLYALNTADGTEKWHYQTAGAINSTPVVYANTVFVGDYDCDFYALDAATGIFQWKFPADAAAPVTPKDFFWAEPVVVNGVIYAPNLDGHVYALDTTTGKLVKDISLGDSISSAPVVIGNKIVVATSVASYATSKQKVNIYIIDISDNSISIPIALPLHEGVNAPLFADGNIVYIHTYKDNLYTINTAAPQTQPTLLFDLNTLK